MTNLLGLIAGLLMLVGGALSDHVPLSSLFNMTALIIVIGGTVSATMAQFGFTGLVLAVKSLAWLIKPPKADLAQFIEHVAEWSSMARSQGTLALESVVDSVTEPFQRQGLQMIIDNTPPEELPKILNIVAENTERRQHMPGEVWEAMGGYSPTIGVMGAVLGLIHVMMRLDHPEELGEGIATAFIATIYGVGFANLICLPLGTKMKHMALDLERERHVIATGFSLLAEGKPGILIRQNLQNYIQDGTKPKPKDEADDAPAGASQAA